jgi:hypothetical protein
MKMKKMINKTHIEGLMYEIVESKVAPSTKDPSNQYARGTIAVQIEENNIVEWEFLVMEYTENKETKVRTKNSNFQTILGILASPTVVKDGVDAAASIKIDSSLDLYDFYSVKNNRAGVKLRSFGGFPHLIAAANPSATFEVDMLITSTTEEMSRNADGDMMPNGNLEVQGIIFNFKKETMPVKFTVESTKGIGYFASLSQNTFTKVWGKITTEKITTSAVEESAFGDAKVVEYSNVKKKFILTGASTIPYEFGAPEVLSVDEVQKGIANRNVKLEEVKSEAIARANSSSSTSAAAPVQAVVTNASNTDFKF